VITNADIALLDGTFHAEGELPGRSMAEIPHPFIVESLARFASLPAPERAKVRFIHLNQSNPALDPASEARRQIERAGCGVAEQGERWGL
jgi:pyrroloquinoline quinone biosynthesis protein B